VPQALSLFVLVLRRSKNRHPTDPYQQSKSFCTRGVSLRAQIFAASSPSTSRRLLAAALLLHAHSWSPRRSPRGGAAPSTPVASSQSSLAREGATSSTLSIGRLVAVELQAGQAEDVECRLYARTYISRVHHTIHLSLQIEVETDRIRTDTNSNITDYHILAWIQIRIRISSDTNTK
jgi:hypothetical protein